MDITAGLAIFGVILGAVSTILHFVAPMTSTKWDDKAAEGVDFVKDRVLPVADAMAPSKAPPVGFSTTGDRDHRK